MNANSIPLSGLTRALIQKQRIREKDVLQCMSEASDQFNQLLVELIRKNLITAEDLALFASTLFGFPYLDLAAVDIEKLPEQAIDNKLANKHELLTLAKRGSLLFIGVADPSNLRALDEIRFQTGLNVSPVVVEVDKLRTHLNKGSSSSGLLAVLGTMPNEASQPAASQEQVLEEMLSDEEDAPVVKFIQKILTEAITEKASDIHFEPYEKFYRIRYRTDGQLREITQPPLILKERIASRLKIISRLNIAERRVPQDGRTKLTIDKNKVIDFRVSTLPTVHGEKVVLRLLDPDNAPGGIDSLGYEPEQKAMMLEAVSRPYGMILVTGPTGSGKTVSLYTCLEILNAADINISTAEDPAEMNIPGVNQVSINEKAGLSFASALRSFLRQDPDVIMVGEIRDLETAEIAIKAAQTGHLVLSTLHTNDAPATLERLKNMGVPPFNIASSVNLITAQRLIRRLCQCKAVDNLPRQILLDAGFSEEQLDGSWQPYKPVGCTQCGNSGYKGRVGIYQVMPISNEISQLIMNNGNSIEIAVMAKKQGVLDLRGAGLLKIKAGITSLAEVIASTNG